MHADLPRVNGDSAFRSRCPACEPGVLFVQRHRTTYAIINTDYCSHCGQQFVYTDSEIANEPVTDATGKADAPN